MDFNFDFQFNKPVIGVDEVGRGSWAGPVMAGAALLNYKLPIDKRLNDSKKLTPKIRMEILEIFAKLRIEKNLTIIFITHDLASARYLADRILVLSKGTLVEQNKAEDLIKNPESSYTKKLVRAASPGWLNEITK